MSSSSSSSAHRRPRSTTSRGDSWKVCICGTKTPLLTAWTIENGGRRFWSCPHYEKKKKCDYFEWFDDQFPQQAKSTIGYLIEESNDFKNRCEELETREEKLKAMENGLKNREKKLKEKKDKLKSTKEKLKMKEERFNLLVMVVLVVLVTLVCFKYLV